MTVRDSVQTMWRAVVAWGVFAVVLGVLMLLWPGITAAVAAVLFGVYLLISGIAMVISAFGFDERAGTRVLLFISGALSVILAVLAFRGFGEGWGIALLGIWIGVAFAFSGVADLAVAINHRELSGRGWQALTGVVELLAGLIMLVWPVSSVVTLAQVVGVFLIVIGVMQVIKALKLRGQVRGIEKDFAEA